MGRVVEVYDFAVYTVEFSVFTGLSLAWPVSLQLVEFHSKDRSPAKNGYATATIAIKAERLAHHCVEQDLLYS